MGKCWSNVKKCCDWTCVERCGYGRPLHWNVGMEITSDEDSCCEFQCCSNPECALCGLRQTRCQCCKIPKWFQGCTGLHQIPPQDPNNPKPIPLPEIPELTEGQTGFPLSPLRYPIIWLIGGPASGRRTQGRMLGQHYNFQYIRLQSVLDNQLPSGASKALRLLTLEDKRDLLPPHYLRDMKREMSRGMYFYEGFVIQGCPCNVEDAHKFNKEVGEVFLILHLETSVEEMRSRADGHGEQPGKCRYLTQEGKRQFGRELISYQTTGDAILKEFKKKVVRLNASESSDMTYTKGVETIDYMLRSMGIRPPDRSPIPKPRLSKPDYEDLIEEVKVLAVDRHPSHPSAVSSACNSATSID